MKKFILVVCSLVMVLCGISLSYADQVILQPGPVQGKDMWLSSVYNKTAVDDWRLQAGGWGDEYRFFIQFDLTGLPSNPTSAVLWMVPYNKGDSSTLVGMSIDRITTPWDESTTVYGQTSGQYLYSVSAPTIGYWYGINITGVYNNWKSGVYSNYGLRFHPEGTNNQFSQFYSSDLSSVNYWARPELVVTYNGANLAFPLAGYTPYTVPISSVFDHSMVTPYTPTDSSVVAYTGEIGDYQGYPTDPTCINQASGQPFVINGNYVGSSSCGGSYYLSYDSHPGFDYRVPTGTPVHASATGTITEIQCPSYPGYCTDYGRIRITHSSGYSTWYMHLSQQAGNLIMGSSVNKGDLIGYSGKTSPPSHPVGPHLHFEVRKNDGSNNGYGLPVDPYGWRGEWRNDPYQVGGKDNVCLWENCQWW